MSNRKRRVCVPQRLTEEKRQRLSWDLADATKNVEIVDANNCLRAGLRGSFEENDRIDNEQRSSYGRKGKHRKRTEKEEGIHFKLVGSFPDCWHCVLGTFEMSLSGVRCRNVAVYSSDQNVRDSTVEMLIEVNEIGYENFDVTVVLPISFLSSLDSFQKLTQSETARQVCSDEDSFLQSSFISKERLQALDYLQKKGMVSLVVRQTTITQGEQIEVAVCLHESGLTLLSHSSLDTTLRKSDKFLRLLMFWFFPDTEPHTLEDIQCSNIEHKQTGFESLYGAVKAIRENDCAVCPTAVKTSALDVDSFELPSCEISEAGASDNCVDEVSHHSVQALSNPHSREICQSHDLSYLQHLDLLPTLRSYQRKAVQWMLQRELCQSTDKKQGCMSHPLWRKCQTEDGKWIYFNPYTGRLTRERFLAPPLPCGGILADEMGLGKTVEVLAIILNNPSRLGLDECAEGDDQNLVSSSVNNQDQSGTILGQYGHLPNCHHDTMEDSHTNNLLADVNTCISTSGRPIEQGYNVEYCDSNMIRSQAGNCSVSNKHSSNCNSCNIHSSLCSSENRMHGVLNDAHHHDREANSEASSGFVKTSRSVPAQYHCVCGITEPNATACLLQCVECQALMHAECVGYDQDTDSSFLCPNCAVNKPLVPSGATLIISPASISQQWVEEITRHTRPSALKLLVYEGVLKQGFIKPEMLASYDIILTTYSTLRADFYHVGTRHIGKERSMRFQKRYAVFPSSLTAVNFWRICLDEAQMVESTTAKAAEMALKLHCTHRWCVTGTPIQKGLEDIYGLLLFLGVSPYNQRIWWKTLLYNPYVNGNTRSMLEVLAKIMWRSAKKDVIHEINLPEQSEKVNWLTFTPVEQHFYRRQHEECSITAQMMLGKWKESDTKLGSLDRNTVHRMLNPLLRLRQACCHPQVVRGGFLSMQKSTLTMDQLLDSLIVKAKLECEEAHRKLLFSINGLAGIDIINEEWSAAVEHYRMTISSWREHEDEFRTDALQKLHTLHNLALVLAEGHPGCSRTLRDDQLMSEAEELKKSYMTKSLTQVECAQQNLHEASISIVEIQAKLNLATPWWITALQCALSLASGAQDELLHRVRDELSATGANAGSIIHRFTDLRGLEYIITTRLDTMESTRSSVEEAMKTLSVEPSADMVRTAAECCLRPVQDAHSKRCRFCEVDDIFKEYESRLFGHQGMRGIDEQDLVGEELHDWHRFGNTGGLRAESEAEKALKTILSFIKSHKICPTIYQEARHHLRFIEARRKEFKFLRAGWFALRERVSALDEVDMCTTRLRLLLPGEMTSDDTHVLHPLQVEQQRMKFLSDRIAAQTELRKKLGQLLYLNNLAKSQSCLGGENPDPCPVCTKRLGVQWSVFSCGHCFCCQCVWVLLRQPGIGPRHRDVRIKCPMCRVASLAQEISYVITGRQRGSEDENSDIVVKGSHSTKVEAVVRTLLSIRKNDASAKCLVFSTWQDVLEVISKGLDENDIIFRRISGQKNFHENLQAFKQDPDIPVMLLPLQTGSNGLNIVEATHVLLVEPALNPAHELQAVGRVHRIGQTRPTQVHRFIIRGTVESRMFTLLQSKISAGIRTGSRDTENSTLTVGDLAALFTLEEDWDQFPGPLD